LDGRPCPQKKEKMNMKKRVELAKKEIKHEREGGWI
jgi:hypothetical protein